MFKELGIYSPSSAVEAAVSGALHKKEEAWIDQLAERETEQMPAIKEEMWIL